MLFAMSVVWMSQIMAPASAQPCAGGSHRAGSLHLSPPGDHDGGVAASIDEYRDGPGRC